MKDIILYGNGSITDVIFYYFTKECNYNVVAITEKKKFIRSAYFNGIKVYPFEQIEESHPPSKFCLFVAIGFHNMNDLRALKYLEAKHKGYEIISFIHPLANVPENVEYGENTLIMPDTSILPYAKIGSNVFIWQGTVIGHHSVIGDNCWFSSPTTISGNVKVGKNCFFGANSTVGHDVSIGDYCFLGANSLLVKDLSNEKVVYTEPSGMLEISSKDFSKIFKF